MVDKIEMSLDDIIKTNKIGFRRGGAVNKARKGTAPRNGGGSPRKQQQTTAKFRGGRPNTAAPKGGRGVVRGGVQARKFTRVSSHIT